MADNMQRQPLDQTAINSPSASSQEDALGATNTTDPIPNLSALVSQTHVNRLINIQADAIQKLQQTNQSIQDCNTLAQSKLAATNKLFKRTAKLMNESKRDLDFIYKKILDMKAQIRADRPDLFARQHTATMPDDLEPEQPTGPQASLHNKQGLPPASQTIPGK